MREQLCRGTYWILVKVMVSYCAYGVAHKKKEYSAVTAGFSLQAQVLEHSENKYSGTINSFDYLLIVKNIFQNSYKK